MPRKGVRGKQFGEEPEWGVTGEEFEVDNTWPPGSQVSDIIDPKIEATSEKERTAIQSERVARIGATFIVVLIMILIGVISLTLTIKLLTWLL